jgi:hypothetical protein
MPNTIDLTASNKDYSVFLPSVSTFYSIFVSKQRVQGDHVLPERIPRLFENGVEGCNFLNQEQAYYKYKWGLYSAGHAQLNLKKADADDSMIQQRDRANTFILGDSGGFQILKGVIKCDWPNFKTDDSLRHTILNWLEHTADYSMILDIPTMAADPIYRERTGITGFEDCLDYTKFNCDWFVRNRKGKTKYLNVLQGRNWKEAEYWFDNVKHYPFEGFAFGGSTKYDISTTLKLIIKMRDAQLLEKGERDLLHFLGTSKLEWSVAFTALKRALRKHVNEQIEVTYDCASPFIASAKGQIYTQHVHRNDRFGYVMDSAVDDKRLAKSQIPFPWSSPIGERITMGDICWYAPGDLNKIGKEGKTSWDSFSYFLQMAHNVYQHIESTQRANQLMDLALVRNPTNHKEWHKTLRSKSAIQLDQWVPATAIYVCNFIDDLFKTETPMDMIDEARELLQEFNGKKIQHTESKSISDLFEFESSEEVADANTDEFSEYDQEMAEEFLCSV